MSGPRTPKALIAGITTLLGAGLGAVVAITSSAPVAIVLAGGVALAGLMAWDAGLGVIAYAVLRPVADSFVFVTVGPLSIGQLWGAGLIAISALYAVLATTRTSERFAYSAAPLAFAGAYAFFTLSRDGFSEALSNSLKIASWCLLMVIVERIASTESGRRKVLAGGILTSFLIVIAIAVAVTQNRYGAAYYAGEFEAIGQGPHGLASYAVLCCSFVLFDLLEHRRGIRSFLLLGALVVCVIISLVRTTFIALILLLVMYTIVALADRGGKAIMRALALLGVGAVALYLAQDQVLSRFRDVGYVSQGAGSEIYAGSGRIGIWQAVWNGAVGDPASFIWGRGALSSTKLVYASLGVERWAHNDFLEFLSTGGIILLALYGWVFVWMISVATRLRRSSDHRARNYGGVFLGCIFAFGVMAFFNGIALYQASVAMALACGIASGWLREVESVASGVDSS